MTDIDPFDNLHDITKGGKKEKKTKKEEKQDDNFVKEITKERKQEKDDPKTKAGLIFRIQYYGNNKRFGSYLKNDCDLNFDESFLQRKSVEELEMQIEKINILLSNKSNNNILDIATEGGLNFIETIISAKTKFKINGTTAKLFQDEHFLDLLELLKLKYNVPTLKLDPAVEILFIVLQTGFIQYQTNTVLSKFTSHTNLDEEYKEYEPDVDNTNDIQVKEVEKNE